MAAIHYRLSAESIPNQRCQFSDPWADCPVCQIFAAGAPRIHTTRRFHIHAAINPKRRLLYLAFHPQF